VWLEIIESWWVLQKGSVGWSAVTRFDQLRVPAARGLIDFEETDEARVA
jgi:hypothetical protein